MKSKVTKQAEIIRMREMGFEDWEIFVCLWKIGEYCSLAYCNGNYYIDF